MSLFALLILVPLGLALVMPWLGARFGRNTGWFALAGPIASVLAVIQLMQSGSGTVRLSWIPSLGIDLAFRTDGLSLFFGLVASAIGVLVALYSTSYLDDHYRDHGRFYASLLLFQTAMLLTVFSGNLLMLFAAWELTGIASFLLIGFLHEKEESRRGARMALLTTGGSGLALLAGVVLLRQAFGTFDLDAMLSASPRAGSDGILTAASFLCLLGIAGKSAQFPFHYWLPNAMAAPTPVSAYLHSATMVKLGVFLTARLMPVFQTGDVWSPALLSIGFGTLLIGSVLALLSHDLKAILAYTTVAQLGLLVGYYGLFSTPGSVSWDYLHLSNHVLYKASLFMVVGIIDHSAGTRDIRRLGGLGRVMPITAVVACIGAAALAGLPLTTGFLSKEYLLKTVFEFAESSAGVAAWWVIATVLISSVIKVIIATRFVHRVFFGTLPSEVEAQVHAPSLGIQASPALLALGCVTLGLLPSVYGHALDWFAVSGLHVGDSHTLHLWHGPTRELGTSIAIVVFGLLFYRGFFAKRLDAAEVPPSVKFEHGFEWSITRVPKMAGSLNRALGFETPQTYLLLTSAFIAAALASGALLFKGNLAEMIADGRLLPSTTTGWWRWGLALCVIAATAAVVASREPLKQIFGLSVVGAAIAVYFVMYQAPDLALTQILVETLLLLLVTLIVLRLKRRGADAEALPRRSLLSKTVKILTSSVVGLFLGAGVLVFQKPEHSARAGDFYLENSLPFAKGANAVNTVVIDFRGWDTFGEIVVLLIAALGVLGLLARKRASGSTKKPESREDLLPLPKDLILRVIALGAFVPLNLLSLHLLLRGHNLPGGGFIAGLVTALSIVLAVFAIGVHGVRSRLRFNPFSLAIAGVGIALTVVVLPMFFGRPLLTHFHPTLGSVYLGTPLFFDLGVYLTVVGVSLKLILPLMKSVHGLAAFVREEEGAFTSSRDEPIDLDRSLGKGGKIES